MASCSAAPARRAGVSTTMRAPLPGPGRPAAAWPAAHGERRGGLPRPPTCRAAPRRRPGLELMPQGAGVLVQHRPGPVRRRGPGPGRIEQLGVDRAGGCRRIVHSEVGVAGTTSREYLPRLSGDGSRRGRRARGRAWPLGQAGLDAGPLPARDVDLTEDPGADRGAAAYVVNMNDEAATEHVLLEGAVHRRLPAQQGGGLACLRSQRDHQDSGRAGAPSCRNSSA